MKRILSVLLCFCTLLGGLSLWATGTTAAMVTEIPNAADVPAPKEKTELIFSENFEDPELNTSLTGVELIRELGWFGTLGESDVLSIANDGGNHSVSITATTTRLDTIGILRDNLLAGGDYIMEYTVHLVSNFKDDPERTFGFCSESATTFSSNTNTAWRFAMKEDGTSDHHLKINANKVMDGGNSLHVAAQNGSNSLVGSTYRVRIVVDSSFGVSAYLLDGEQATLISATNAECSELWKQYGSTLGNEIRLYILSGITATFDDIQVWTCKKINKDLPQYVGLQTSAPTFGTTLHDVRLVGGVRQLGADAIGMEVTYHYETIHGDPTYDTKVLFATSIYKAISTDYDHQLITAASQNTSYLMALDLPNVPSKMSVRYEIKPFAIYLDGENRTVEYGSPVTVVLDKDLVAAIPVMPDQNTQSVTEFETNYYRQYYTSVNRYDYDEYISSLTARDYTVYASNTLDDNVYTTLYNGHLMLHVYYMSHTSTISVLSTFKNLWVAHPIATVQDTAVTTPKLAMLNMDYGYNEATETYAHNNGMGFIYTLEDGSYVIIDGGYAAEADDLYNYLVNNNPRTDGKILIRAWIMTHPDGDHIGCFEKFSNEYANLVTLEYFVAQPHISHKSSWSSVKARVSFYDGCQFVTPLAGQEMYFGTLKLEFFYTAEMYRGYTGEELTSTQKNESSLAFKGTLGDYSVFFGGDIMYDSIDAVATYYSTSLKSDLLQIPHHGLNGSRGFYEDILPSQIFLCTHSVAANERWNQGRYDYQSNLSKLKALGCVDTVYVADGQIHVLELSALLSVEG